MDFRSHQKRKSENSRRCALLLGDIAATAFPGVVPAYGQQIGGTPQPGQDWASSPEATREWASHKRAAVETPTLCTRLLSAIPLAPLPGDWAYAPDAASQQARAVNAAADRLTQRENWVNGVINSGRIPPAVIAALPICATGQYYADLAVLLKDPLENERSAQNWFRAATKAWRDAGGQ
jgi:hypothetical protein